MRKITLLSTAHFAKKGEDFSPVPLPHTWNAFDGQDGGSDYHRGECTYRIPLPDPTEGLRTYVEFGGANHVARVSCNGKELGEHKGGFSTFRFDLTPHLLPENNLLTVTVSNEEGNIYPQQADFTFFGGLYRPVSLVEVNEAHFDLLKDGTEGVFVTPSVSGRTRVDAFPVGAEGCEILFSIRDKEGNVVAEAKENAADHVFHEFSLGKVHLWQGLEDPYLYTLEATILKDGAPVDCVNVSYGYRSFYADPQKGFFLNGKSYPLRGVCRHQDREDMGWAITKKEHDEDLDLIGEVGANTIRLAHYQHDAYFYQRCDEKGFVLWAEIPFISKFIHGEEARENTLSQMKELVAQNYNHPSICFWGISNEITIGPESEELYQNLCDLNALVKALDPSRPTTMAQLARVKIDSPHNTITDVVSYNVYYGWYTGSLDDNEAFIDEFHAAYPDKALGISEYGADHLICWHSANPFGHDYTEEYACLYHHHMLSIFETRPFLWATHVWNMFDFAVDQRKEGGIAGRNCKGLVTFDRKTKKDTFYLYKAFWSKEPTVHVAGRRFANRAPEERNVAVYTNAKEVSLFLDGKLFATKEAEKHVALFENVPLQAGENLITAKIQGAEDSIPLYGVEKHDESYDLPDVAEALSAGNWFLEEEEEKDWGEEGYGIHVQMKYLCKNEACAKILRGWIMSNSALAVSEKLHTTGRLPIWAKSAPGEKLPREINIFKAKFTDEQFAELDKRLHSVKRD